MSHWKQLVVAIVYSFILGGMTAHAKSVDSAVVEAEEAATDSETAKAEATETRRRAEEERKRLEKTRDEAKVALEKARAAEAAAKKEQAEAEREIARAKQETAEAEKQHKSAELQQQQAEARIKAAQEKLTQSKLAKESSIEKKKAAEKSASEVVSKAKDADKEAQKAVEEGLKAQKELEEAKLRLKQLEQELAKSQLNSQKAVAQGKATEARVNAELARIEAEKKRAESEMTKAKLAQSNAESQVKKLEEDSKKSALELEKIKDSFSRLADASSYKQNSVYTPRKVDILWVVDNSGSMASSQKNLTDHFQSFIEKFMQTNSDFHMAVTTTDAYLTPYDSLYADYSKIRDGVTNQDLNNHSGVFVMKKDTPNLNNVFLTNITQGIRGAGDERAFSSIEATLKDTRNAGFRRADAFLAVIIVSDEDDFSHNDLTTGLAGYYFTENYSDPNMFSIQRYMDFLTNFTSAAGSGTNFSVNAITIFDQACFDQLKGNGQKFSQRYGQLVTASSGKLISLCSDFSTSLQDLSRSILELSSEFSLARLPIESTIVVTVNGVVVPQGATNGWTYKSASNSIVFHGSAIPQAGADVRINFDPAGVKN